MLDIRVVQDYIRGHEGLSLKPYLCTAGKITIGIGRNLDDRGITIEEAMIMFQHDINSAITDLTRVFNEFSKFPEAAQLVFIDMLFQMGLVRFCGFKKMIEYAKALDWKNAAKELMDSNYARQTPSRAQENRDKLLSI